MMNGTTQFDTSARSPTNRNPQPPTGVIIRIDEALFVRLPRLRTAKEKIVGNMMASKRKIPKRAPNETIPKFINTTIVQTTQPQPQMKSIFSAGT